MRDGKPLVLIVDDEPMFREIFRAKFESAGLSIETAFNGEEGIIKAKTLKPDLVLMDMKMPGMTGADALLKLKEDPETKNIKVVFLSSIGDARKEMQAIDNKMSQDLGAAGYLKKTDDLENLLKDVQSYLQ